MKAAIYARVSDDRLNEQGERLQDVQRQVQLLKEYAARAGLEVTPEFVFVDDARSAWQDDYQSRPAFVRLLREVKGHHVQRVLVEDMTRWARRLEEGLRTLREAGEAGCTVTSIHEGDIDATTTEGWAKSAMALFFAEWAARAMAEKIRSGMKRRAQDARATCRSCGVVHLGRHPRRCQCLKCRVPPKQGF